MKAPVKALLVDVAGERADTLLQLLQSCGIALLPGKLTESSLYQRLHEIQPDLIFVDVNSPARDTLEHVVSSHPEMPQSVVSADGDLSISLRRLAGDIGISLYVGDTITADLLQALIDLTISHCHSIKVLERELALQADTTPVAAALH